MKRKSVLLASLLFTLFSAFGNKDTIQLADPTIFFNDGTYYLYGTGGPDGFLVYTSKDLLSWSGPAGVNKGYALSRGQAFGKQGFWAPQVFSYNKKFYMAYTADEHIAIAESNNPLGPFVQKELAALSAPVKQIDPFVFIDDDGKKYLYHVRLQEGNRIFVARLKDDFSGIEEATLKECIHADVLWENTASAPWPVTEGPSVLKHNGLYYLVYSANDFRNINYAVGYATSKSPFGPWQKSAVNPFLSPNNLHQNGTGHGDFVKDSKGNLNYVFHTHASDKKVSPRITAIVESTFSKNGKGASDAIIIQPNTFRYLLKD